MSNIEVYASEFETPSRPTTSDKKSIHTPLQAIRKHCLACCCDARGEVRNCFLYDCYLWPYRFGKRPVGDA